MSQNLILIVDDEANILSSISAILKDEGYLVNTARSGKEALESIKQEVPDLILLDIWMPEMDGLTTLQRIRDILPNVGVIMISGHATIETAVKATKLGATNFIEKPLSMHRLVIEVEQALKHLALEQENRQLREQVAQQQQMVGDSQLIRALRDIIATAGPTNGRVLISGESGTGKELVAREIHHSSLRAGKPFIEVNCAAIPEDLIESELFGHEKGAFTNATYQKKGKFELANTGTLFLDEVGDMSLKTQAKVLRVLEEGRIERVGSHRSIDVDVRVIAASNKNLQEEIQKNRFREDLYFRLNVIPIHISPLRDHPEDIQSLVEYYLERYAKEYGKHRLKISGESMEVLRAYPWPGNVRELRNEIERVVIMTSGTLIRPSNLRETLLVRSKKTTENTLEIDDGDDLKSAREKFERNFILDHLTKNRWNITQTAEALGIERSNLHRKMKLLGISSTPS